MDDKKDLVNRNKHGTPFFEAQKAFLDPQRVIAEDLEHSHSEKKYYKQNPHHRRGLLAKGEKLI